MAPGTVAGQAPLSMGVPRQEYWEEYRQEFPSPGDLLGPGIQPKSPALQADSLPSEPPGDICIITLCVYVSVCVKSVYPDFLM